MTARTASLAAVAAFLLLVSADAAMPASAKRAPPQVFRALKTTIFQPATVARRFSSAQRTVATPSASAQRHHAIGTLRITFRRGEGTIDYTVFRSHTAALNTSEDDVTAATPMSNFQERLRVYGIDKPNVLYLGACASVACDSYFSTASIVNGYVKIDVTVAALPDDTNYDQAATMILARAANAHLVRLS